jgi:hypothetical protein
VTFTLARFTAATETTHRFGEQMHLQLGFVFPVLILLSPDIQAEAIPLLGGKPGPAGTAALRRRAVRVGAVAATFTCESWVGYPSMSLQVMDRMAPEDLPLPADMPDRRESVATTGIWPGGHATLHLLSIIDHDADGSRIQPAQRIPARDYGTNRWLQSLLPAP